MRLTPWGSRGRWVESAHYGDDLGSMRKNGLREMIRLDFFEVHYP